MTARVPGDSLGAGGVDLQRAQRDLLAVAAFAAAGFTVLALPGVSEFDSSRLLTATIAGLAALVIVSVALTPRPIHWRWPTARADVAWVMRGLVVCVAVPSIVRSMLAFGGLSTWLIWLLISVAFSVVVGAHVAVAAFPDALRPMTNFARAHRRVSDAVVLALAGAGIAALVVTNYLLGTIRFRPMVCVGIEPDLCAQLQPSVSVIVPAVIVGVVFLAVAGYVGWLLGRPKGLFAVMALTFVALAFWSESAWRAMASADDASGIVVPAIALSELLSGMGLLAAIAAGDAFRRQQTPPVQRTLAN
jgi:hypothetical protein